MFGHNIGLRIYGYVEWEKRDIETGVVTANGHSNRILEYGLGEALKLLIGTRNSDDELSANAPNYIVISTLTDAIDGTEVGIEPVDTVPSTIITIGDGNDRGKAITNRTLRTNQDGRYEFSYDANDFDGTIRRVGLFDDEAGADGRMWAITPMNVTKTPTELLTIYWNIGIETDAEQSADQATANPILAFSNSDIINNQAFTIGTDIGDINLPTPSLSNSGDEIVYSIANIPDGLTLTNNVLAGTPTTALVETEFTYKATAEGLSTTLAFNITIT